MFFLFVYIYFIDHVVPKVMLSLKDGVVECSLAQKKVTRLVWLGKFLMLLRFYFAGRGGFETIRSVKLNVFERILCAPTRP